MSVSKVNVDDILQDLHKIHTMNAVIPLSYFMDTAKVLVRRNDATRLELLIHICRDNNRTRGNQLIGKTELQARQSRPVEDPLDALVSFVITSLFSNGNQEDASKLWVRMTNSGFVTNRHSMDRIIDKIALSAPSLVLLSSLHGAMKANLWNQSPVYYTRALRIVRQNLLKNCKDVVSLRAGLVALDDMWRDANLTLIGDASGRLPVELHALRVHCYAAALQSARSIEGLSSSEEISQARAGALAAFNDVLDQAEEVPSISSLAEEIKDILLSVHTDETPFMSEASTVPVKVAKGHFSLYGTVGDTRRATSLLLTQLASQGQTDQAVTLLRHYIDNRQGVSADETPSATNKSFVLSENAFKVSETCWAH